jgi:hypothetical protein
MSRRMVDQFAEDAMGEVVQLPGTVPAKKQLSMNPQAIKSRQRRATQKALKKHVAKASKKPTGGTTAAPEPAPAATLTQHSPDATAALPQPQSGSHPALEHIGVAIVSALLVALMVKVAYGSFATIEGTAAYMSSAEQAANLAWSIVGAEILLGLFLGLCHKVVRFRRLGKALVVMLVLVALVEASMAWVRTEASIHKAVDAAYGQPVAASTGAPSGTSVAVSTEGRSRGAIRDMTGLATAAASLAKTQADDQARKDAREDARADKRVANAKDRSQLARVIPVGAAVVQAGATELGGLAVAEFVWSLLGIAALIVSRKR